MLGKPRDVVRGEFIFYFYFFKIMYAKVIRAHIFIGWSVGFSAGVVSLEGMLSKSTLQGCKNLTVKEHRYGSAVVCRCSAAGLVKRLVTDSKRRCSHMEDFCGLRSPSEG